MKRKNFILLFTAAWIFLSIETVEAKKIHIITRQEWGANEEFTLEKNEPPSTETPNNEQNGEDHGPDAQNEANEADPEIERIVEQDENGRKFVWPLQYAKEIKFIVMHYTALKDYPDDPLTEIRNIYHSHAVGKGWGDIGYHYLIDRKGNIYEGRKGGDFVVGGHAKPLNKISIGIALMGNYEDEELPAPMLKSTIELLDEISKKYSIDPLGQTEYKGKIYPNIQGHKDNTPKLDPGRYFYEKFQKIRQLVAYRRAKKKKAKPAKYNFSPMGLSTLITLPQEKETKISIRVKNKGEVIWDKNTYLENTTENGLPRIFARIKSEKVEPGALGTFEAIIPPKYASGMLMPYVSLVVNGSIRPQKSFPIAMMVEASEKPLRVAINFTKKKPKIMSATGMKLLSGQRVVAQFRPGEIVTVALLKSGKYRVRVEKKKITLDAPPRFKANGGGTLTVVNLEKRPAWNPALNDNVFRGVLEITRVDDALTVINELPLEDYLKGIAEISNGDPPEKIKTIIILARSYARYYRDKARKFPGKPYDLDDDPDRTQKYLGYGLELRSPNIAKAVRETEGKIVTYEGKPVITPYFSQSDGRTRSAEEVWGWKDRPYLKSVPDSFCGTTELKGHGVGVSGCGATELAKQGKTAEEIIKYYYAGVKIE
ncbi:SpoIID/LytB domain-containing protein [Candidatus Peregrinibacteria bacterium]|nr:SpoIID/LytB domain-containing protein [Candidatus Peregrinibacteria bacterium]